MTGETPEVRSVKRRREEREKKRRRREKEKKRERKERKRYLKKVKGQELCQIGPLTSAALFHKLSD